MEQLQALHDDGHDVPAIRDRPRLPYELEDLFESFCTLSQSRQRGFDIGPIPLTEIKAFVELFHVQDVDFFIAIIRGLDADYLKLTREKERQKANATK